MFGRCSVLRLVALAASTAFAAAAARPSAAQSAAFRPTETAAPAGWSPTSATADVDGDGDDDLVSRFPLLADSGLYLPAGGPPPAMPAVPSIGPATIVAAADFDLDGDDDVIALLSPSTMAFNFGDPSGVLQNVATTMLGFNADAIAAGDFDGDGDPDLVLSAYVVGPSGSPVPTGLRLWRNDNAAIVDVTPTAGLAPCHPSALRLTDLDGDGRADLLVENRATSILVGVHLQRSLGGGVFAPPVTLGLGVSPTNSSGGFASAVGDFDGDGLKDLAVAAPNPPALTLFRHLSPFVFAATTTLSPAVPTPGGSPAFALVDLDGDGGDELLLGTESGIEVLPIVAGAPVASRATLPAFPQGMFALDADGDGDRDVAAISVRPHGRSDLRLLFNDGTGVPYVLPTRGDTFVGAAARPFVADMDGDGDPDLVSYRTSGALGAPVIALNDGEGGFVWRAPSPCPGCLAEAGVYQGAAEPPVVAAFDADGDGVMDVFAANLAGGRARLLRGDGSGGFVDVGGFALNGRVTDLEVADVDGDGDLDVIGSRAFTTGSPATWHPGFVGRNLGGVLAGPEALMVPSGTPNLGATDVLARDFDADGDVDVLLAAASYAIIESNVGGAFAPLSILVASAGPAGGLLDAGDLDGDGDLDLVYNRSIRLQTAPMSFVAAGLMPPVGPLPSDCLLFDRDFDGDFDALDFATLGGTVHVNDGSGAFSAAPSEPLSFEWEGPHYRTRPTLIDLDGDGDVDAVERFGVVHAGLRRHLARRRALDFGALAEAQVFGPPNASFVLAVSAPVPFPSPTPFGALGVDPSTAVILGVGLLDANGVAILGATFVGPAALASVGVPFSYQAAVFDGSIALTNVRTVTAVDY